MRHDVFELGATILLEVRGEVNNISVAAAIYENLSKFENIDIHTVSQILAAQSMADSYRRHCLEPGSEKERSRNGQSGEESC